MRHLRIETSASTSFNNYDIETLENGYYYETIIEEKESPNTIIPTGAVKYITKTKTTSMKNSNGELLWSLSIEATFSYNGSSAQCINCSHSYNIVSSAWTLSNITSTYSGNSATASAIATHTVPSGNSQSYKKTVTITCNGLGVVS